MSNEPVSPNSVSFKAETRQLLNILIHSLYSEREVFLRELISNASDSLTRINFEMLTNREVLDPETELGIWITVDEEAHTLSIRDTGIGMTAEELAENLGTIAHSGAKAFLEAAQHDNKVSNDIIGQFGVGFYSAFMVADWIRVTSRSYRPDAQAASWYSTGSDTFTVEPAEKSERGTLVTIKLKEDADEFTKEYRIDSIVKKHSDYVPYPIYFGPENKQINRQTAIWRQAPHQVEKEAYTDFYKQFSLESEAPLLKLHLNIDAPVQLYALLYVPAKQEHGILSLRRQDGIKLYARKVLIQEYSKDLLPEFLRFVQGVVDTEDLPLNVSRETIQSNRVIMQIKKVVTSKLLDLFKNTATDKPDEYAIFWEQFGLFIKEGIATDFEHYDALLPLLRFHSVAHPDKHISLDDYVKEMKAGQDKIYYIVGDDEKSVLSSPHLEILRRHEMDVLLLTDVIDTFMLMRLEKYLDFQLVNAASDELNLPEKEEEKKDEETSPAGEEGLVNRFKQQLGERVTNVRITNRLVESPARLVDQGGSAASEMQRAYRLLNKDFEVPKMILEVNPKHPIIKKLESLSNEDAFATDLIEQIYENCLLQEGLHPNPAQMVSRIQKFMEASLK
ncbi:MAG: molecular chaperone HtpG [Anaerolineae bacterium]|nr:molecular chaperone HtpG [Anaerolineae bacterium]